MTEERDETVAHLYTNQTGLQYLRDKWGAGFESWSMDSFKHHRIRHGVYPIEGKIYTQAMLDRIPKPDRTKPRPTRRKKTPNGTNGGEIPSVILREKAPLRRPLAAALAPAC